jgi:hypothetical protein
MLATTALFALSGVTVAAADISISGHVRYHYDAWSDDKDDTDAKTGNNNNSFDGDLQLWVKGETVTDSGLTYGAAVRFRDKGDTAESGGKDKNQNNVDRRYLTIADDWGKITLGRQWAPTYSMSLGQDWRGTIAYSGGDDVTRGVGLLKTSYLTTSGTDDKVIYETPDISGFKAGVSMTDAGSSSQANSTEFAVQYGMSAFGDGSIKVGYAAASQAEGTRADSSKKKDMSEIGAEVGFGDLTASVIQFTQEETPKKTDASNKVEKQSGQELDVAYNATDSLTLNLVYFSAKMTESLANKDDKYKWTGVGAKYTIAPGLYTSLGYKKFDFTDNSDKKMNNSGNTIRVRVHASF